MAPRKHDDATAEREELRKAFKNMALFDIRSSTRSKQRWDIWTKGGLWVGHINRGVGNLFMRTLGVLTDQARRRTLRELPYPAKAQTRRGARVRAVPPHIPNPTPIHLCTPASVPASHPDLPNALSE